MPLLILDRDGVINHDSDNYIRALSDWVPIPGAIEAIAELSRSGYEVAIATNQSGLARGYFSIGNLEVIHEQLRSRVARQGGRLATIAHCPHGPEAGCNCRKPGTGLLHTIEQRLGQSAAGAFFIGDSLKDLQAARSHGCRPALVKTGKGLQTLAALNSPSVDIDAPGEIPVFDNLPAAARWLLSNP